jgi:hypothetical protein
VVEGALVQLVRGAAYARREPEGLWLDLKNVYWLLLEFEQIPEARPIDEADTQLRQGLQISHL